MNIGAATARSASPHDARGAGGRAPLAVLSRISMQSVVRTTRRSPGVVVAAAVLGTRLPVLLLGALAVTIVGAIPAPQAEALWRVSAHELTNMLARWDTFYYFTIATDGYAWNPAVFHHENVVFFPLYPMLMRGGGALLGGHPLLAGLIVSLTAFTGALVLLYRLAVLEVGEEYAWRVILLISTFPFAVFYSAVYTESLFLLLSVGAFYAMRRGRLGWVVVCGVLAGLARPNGCWLALPLACLALWPPDRHTVDATARPQMRLRSALLAACVPIIGVAVFSGYLHIRVGDALAWVHGQAAWGMPLLGRPSAPDPGKLPGQPSVTAVEVIVYIADIVAFFWAAASIWPITKRFGLGYGVWIAVNIFPPVVAHLFMSLGRFTSVMFPLFFLLATRVPRERLMKMAAAFAVCQAVFAIWFFLWKPVI